MVLGDRDGYEICQMFERFVQCLDFVTGTDFGRVL
jgi:hypothetical protein